MRVAVLNVDPISGKGMADELSGLGYLCHLFQKRSRFEHYFRRQSFDLVILDWGVEIDLIREFKLLYPSVPLILLLSKHRDEQTLVDALGAGVDAYLFKPVAMDELLSRMTALLRRSLNISLDGAEYVVGPYRFDLARNIVFRGDEPLSLTIREYELALMIMRNVGRKLSRDHLRETLWNGATLAESRTLDTHISRLRTKLGLGAEVGYSLVSVFNFGYQLIRST